MSTIQELRAKAQADGQELENAERQILAEKKQIEKKVDAINGEISAYNKIEPPVEDVPNEAPPSEG